VTYVENTAASNAESSSEQKPKGQRWKRRIKKKLGGGGEGARETRVKEVPAGVME
jgi:hypothetical protein